MLTNPILQDSVVDPMMELTGSKCVEMFTDCFKGENKEILKYWKYIDFISNQDVPQN